MAQTIPKQDGKPTGGGSPTINSAAPSSATGTSGTIKKSPITNLLDVFQVS